MIALLNLVGLERVADPGARRDVIDVEQHQILDAGGIELGEVLRRHLVAGLDVDLAGRLVDEVIGRVTAEDFLGRDQQGLQTILAGLVGGTRADLRARREDNLAGVGVNDVVHRLLATPVLDKEGNLPAAFAAHIGSGLVELVEDLLA